jgi:hypothetical protein
MHLTSFTLRTERENEGERKRERTVRHLATSRGTAIRCYGNTPLASDPRASGSQTPPPALLATESHFNGTFYLGFT